MQHDPNAPDFVQAQLNEVIAAFEAQAATKMGLMISPIKGSDGNVEFLAHFRVGDDSPRGAGHEASRLVPAVHPSESSPATRRRSPVSAAEPGRT